MKTHLLLILAVHVCALAGQAAITVSITTPNPNGMDVAGDSLQVYADVSSTFELASVVAEVSGRQTTLNPGNPFGGVVSLAGLPAGQRSVVVTATDVFSNVGSAQNSF